MEFWSDLSTVVKVVIVVGLLGVLVAGASLMGIGPFGPDADSAPQQQRGLQPQ